MVLVVRGATTSTHARAPSTVTAAPTTASGMSYPPTSHPFRINLFTLLSNQRRAPRASGATSGYCDGGCQAEFGECNAPPCNGQPIVSENGLCGGNTFQTCAGSSYGDCCSANGNWCVYHHPLSLPIHLSPLGSTTHLHDEMRKKADARRSTVLKIRVASLTGGIALDGVDTATTLEMRRKFSFGEACWVSEWKG